jgi:hypothetical protein
VFVDFIREWRAVGGECVVEEEHQEVHQWARGLPEAEVCAGSADLKGVQTTAVAVGTVQRLDEETDFEQR